MSISPPLQLVFEKIHNLMALQKKRRVFLSIVPQMIYAQCTSVQFFFLSCILLLGLSIYYCVSPNIESDVKKNTLTKGAKKIREIELFLYFTSFFLSLLLMGPIVHFIEDRFLSRHKRRFCI